MKIELVTPEKMLYSGEAAQVQVPSEKSGEIGILEGHQSLFSRLSEGTVKIHTPSDGLQSFPIKGGFVSVDSNIIRILAD